HTASSAIYTLSLHDALPILTLRTGESPAASWATRTVTRYVSAQRLRPSRPAGYGTRQVAIAPWAIPTMFYAAKDWRQQPGEHSPDRKSTRLNSSHVSISYAV